jgi:hypothetical protein
MQDMDPSARFRQLFANRLASAIGLGAVIVPTIYACSGKAVVDGEPSSGSGGASSSANGSTSSNSSSQSGVGGATTTTSGSGGDELCTESTTTAAGGPNPMYHYTMCIGDDTNAPCPPAAQAQKFIEDRLLQDCCVQADSCEELRSIDCGPFDGSSGTCCFEITTEEIFCAVPGRPFADCGDALVSELVDGEGWLGAVGLIDVSGLSPAERERRAAKWARAALGEHASVASFSRFALQLMAVGAPAELVAAAQRAAADEVEHARLAFAVASAYASHPVGPGPLPMPDAPMGTSLVELAVATAEEGCINETVSTLRAQADLAATESEAERAVLHRIVADETRHAELAWQTVAWAITAGGDEVREAVRVVFERARGMSDPALTDVVLPVADALLAA